MNKLFKLCRYQSLPRGRRAVTGEDLTDSLHIARIALNRDLARLQAHVWRH